MVDPLSKLFRFPVVMIDAESEEHRKKLSLPGDEDVDTIIGEVEYPYYDFSGIGDRWMPNQQSLQNAREGKFNACSVTFANVGTLLVPWTREKFKRKFVEFVNAIVVEPERNVPVLLTIDRSSLDEMKEAGDGKSE